MEFTGFCYSNSRVSPFYLRNFFFFGGGNGGGGNGRWGVTENSILKEQGWSFVPMIAARTCQEFFEA